MINLKIDTNATGNEDFIKIEVKGDTIDLLAEFDIILINFFTHTMIESGLYNLYELFKSPDHLNYLQHEIGKELIEQSIKD